MATAVEQVGRSATSAENASRSRTWMVYDATDEADAIVTVASAAPSTLNSLSLRNVSVTETAVIGVYDATVTYGQYQRQTVQAVGDTDRVSFDFGQENINVKRSISTTSYGTDPPDHNGAIGVQRDADGRVLVEGVDIPSPTLTFSKTVTVDLADVDNTFIAAIGNLVWKTNDDTFAGFDAGEVVLTGASGAQRGSGDFEVTYRFARRANQTGLTIGGISSINKEGWEYLEVLWEDEEDATSNIMVPNAKAVFVHQVFEEGELDTLPGLT